MADIGRVQTLVVDRVDGRGIWLQGEVLLPSREVEGSPRPGERLEVFVFRDGAGQLRGTLRPPLAQVGEFARLSVRSVGEHGAFLDWGVEKDLLVPFRHQPERMAVGRPYLVRLALDREGRPFASARLDSFVEEKASGVNEGDEVALVVWQFTDLGAKVIVDHRFSALLYRDELPPRLHVGDRLRGYVKRLREDGKADVTLQKVGAAAAEEARETVLVALRKSGGFLPLNDDSTPEEIRRILGISKKAFKKAVGGLYKGGELEIADGGIGLKKK